jgi:hypothetical protein
MATLIPPAIGDQLEAIIYENVEDEIDVLRVVAGAGMSLFGERVRTDARGAWADELDDADIAGGGCVECGGV